MQHAQEVLRRRQFEFVVGLPVRDEVGDLHILVAHQLRPGATNQRGGLLDPFGDVQAPMALDVPSPLSRLDQGEILLGLGNRATADAV